MNKLKATPQQIEWAREQRKNGVTLKQIAKALNVTDTTIRRYTKDCYEKTKRGAKNALNAEQVEWARARYIEGYSMKQIGEALFLHENTIGRYIGKTPRPKHLKKKREPLHYDFSEIDC